MDLVDKFLIALTAASWGLYYFSRKNLAFGLAVGITLFSVMAIAINL